MSTNKMQEIQQQFLEFQKTVLEKEISQNENVTVVMNGNIEIISLTYDATFPPEQLNELLKDTINKCIKKTSLKINEALQAMGQQLKSLNQ